jgi:prephenate dehydrogenase
MTSPNSRHAHVVGLGLIGASVALALKETGWIVTGVDSVTATVTSALDGG